MDKKEKLSLSRRKFLGSGLLSAAGLTVLPQVGRAEAPSETVDSSVPKLRVGFIGVGRQAMGILNGFLPLPGIEVVACSDVYGIKRERFLLRARDYYSKNGQNI